MRNILDKLFENKKLAMLIPIITAAVVYLLFVLFGKGEDKLNLVITIPIVCVFWFFGVFLIFLMQVKNAMCPEKFLDFFELLVTVGCGAYSIIGALAFIIGGCQSSVVIVICATMISHSSIAWAHSKRKNNR